MSTRSAIVAITSSVLLLVGSVASSPAAQAHESDESLAARLKLLEDREAIRTLLVTYGRLLDRQDLVGYSNLFAADGVWEGGIGVAKGPEEIRRMLERVNSRVEPGRWGNSYHIMSDFLIEVDGDTATSWSRWTWVVEGEKGTPVIQRSGHYEDKLVREGGQWRFKHRLTVTEMPTPEKDSEAHIYRKDHRDSN